MPFFTDSAEGAVEGIGAARRIGWMRFVGNGLGAIPIASIIIERQDGALAWILLLLNALAWPALALLLTQRSRQPAVVQFRCMVADSFFGGGWIAFMALSAVPSALFAALLVAALSVFFQKTKTGRALRAVADDHQAAQSIGIPLSRIWVIVWSVAGGVALVVGIIWGSKLGVQYSLSLVALKALPVVILGGLTSLPGAIIGGLIIGVGEKLSEVYLGPMVGGGIETWFAYGLALCFLLVRPQGLFGDKIIDRV